MKQAPLTRRNKAGLAGKFASRPAFFGEHCRYRVQAVHTRFDVVTWFAFDDEQVDELTGGPLVIRQEDTYEAAGIGLEG